METRPKSASEKRDWFISSAEFAVVWRNRHKSAPLWEIEGGTPVKQVLGEKRILAGNVYEFRAPPFVRFQFGGSKH
jgi:hypothetical protein